MSRIVKRKLIIPASVSFSYDKDFLNVTGPLGNVDVFIGNLIKPDLTNGIDFVVINKEHPGGIGTVYVLTKNAIKDVVEGYEASLKMIGVGFKASLNGKFLRLFVGFSHDVVFWIPNDLTIRIVDDTTIFVKGFDRKKVMKFAKSIRDIKKPEPYKGKGIFLNGEKVLRKAGKKK